jgi:hypothetical protein
VLSDAAAAEQFARIVDELRRDYGALRVATPARATPQPGGTTFHVGDWEDYLDRCRGRVGATTLAFSLGIPLHFAAAGTTLDINWDEDVLDDDQAGALDDDTPDEIDETDALPPSPTLDLYAATDHARQRYRRVADTMIHNWRDPDPHERLLALRLSLVLVAGQAWRPGDDSWADLVLDDITNLTVDDPTPEYEEAAGSLAALALSVVRSTLSPHEHTAIDRRLERVTATVSHLLVAATRDRVAGYAEGLERRFPAFSDPDVVMELRDRAFNADPIADALDALLAQRLDATAAGVVIRLPKPVPDPLLPAWQALRAAEHAPLVAIKANGAKGWATLLWRAPDLVVIRPGAKPASMFCTHYRYPADLSPSVDLHTEQRPASRRIVAETFAGQPLLPIAKQLLAAAGLTRAAF